MSGNPDDEGSLFPHLGGAPDETDASGEKLFYRIGEAAALVGVEAHVLRYWETEFKLNTPRSSTGQRMYRRKDIADFMQIRRLLHEDGFTIAGARKAMQDGEIPAPGAELPAAPAAPIAAAGGADLERVREAIERIASVRRQVKALRDRYAAAGVAARKAEG